MNEWTLNEWTINEWMNNGWMNEQWMNTDWMMNEKWDVASSCFKVPLLHIICLTKSVVEHCFVMFFFDSWKKVKRRSRINLSPVLYVDFGIWTYHATGQTNKRKKGFWFVWFVSLCFSSLHDLLQMQIIWNNFLMICIIFNQWPCFVLKVLLHHAVFELQWSHTDLVAVMSFRALVQPFVLEFLWPSLLRDPSSFILFDTSCVFVMFGC